MAVSTQQVAVLSPTIYASAGIPDDVSIRKITGEVIVSGAEQSHVRHNCERQDMRIVRPITASATYGFSLGVHIVVWEDFGRSSLVKPP
jgi:hypothetical protein